MTPSNKCIYWPLWKKKYPRNYMKLHLVREQKKLRYYIGWWGEDSLFTSPEENVIKKLYETTSGGWWSTFIEPSGRKGKQEIILNYI